MKSSLDRLNQQSLQSIGGYKNFFILQLQQHPSRNVGKIFFRKNIRRFSGYFFWNFTPVFGNCARYFPLLIAIPNMVFPFLFWSVKAFHRSTGDNLFISKYTEYFEPTWFHRSYLLNVLYIVVRFWNYYYFLFFFCFFVFGSKFFIWCWQAVSLIDCIEKCCMYFTLLLNIMSYKPQFIFSNQITRPSCILNLSLLALSVPSELLCSPKFFPCYFIFSF